MRSRCAGSWRGYLKRRHRLTGGQRFRQVRQTGSSYSHPLCILCVLPNEQDVSRSGFVTSRRIGNAVIRNRARRRVREAVRLLWDLVEPGWDLVWIARPAINGATFPELQSACARLLGRARLLKAGCGNAVDPTTSFGTCSSRSGELS